MTKAVRYQLTFAFIKKSPLEKLTILAFTHKHFYLSELGKLVVDNDLLEERIRNLSLRIDLGIEEIFYLSTCNRVEFVMATSSDFTNSQIHVLLEHFYAHFSPTQLSNLGQFAKLYKGQDALRHLFQVSCSIDSMVVGEREITRQLRQAYEKATELGYTGDFLRLVMKQTIKIAKEVYTETRIAEKPISVASLAVRKLIDFNFDENVPIVMIGAGETNTLVAKYLKKEGFKNFTIYNRTLEKAELLAESVGGVAYPLDELVNHEETVRVIFTCTAAPAPILNRSIWSELKKDNVFPPVIIDLAVPNDVEKELQLVSTLEYINIDSLKIEVDNNLQFREQELEKANDIIEKGLTEFEGILKIRNLERALSSFPSQVKEIKNKALREVFYKELQSVDAETKLLIERMLTYMEKKCISVPIVLAKQTLIGSGHTEEPLKVSTPIS